MMKARPKKCWSVALKGFETKEGGNGLSCNIADSIQTSKSQKRPSNTWIMEIFAIFDDPPMSEAAKNLLVHKSRPS